MGTIADEAKKCVEIMRKGGVVLYPTDTVWGIGCDATNPEAVKRVYEIKKRQDSKALLLLVDSADRLARYVGDVPTVAWDLIEVASRPLTIIYDDVRYLAPSLAAEDGSAAIRVTSEPFSRELCMRLKRPLVSTSANISGEVSPHCFADINPDLLKAVDYVCTSRREEGENPAASSIIKLKSNGEIVIVRE